MRSINRLFIITLVSQEIFLNKPGLCLPKKSDRFPGKETGFFDNFGMNTEIVKKTPVSAPKAGHYYCNPSRISWTFSAAAG